MYRKEEDDLFYSPFDPLLSLSLFFWFHFLFPKFSSSLWWFRARLCFLSHWLCLVARSCLSSLSPSLVLFTGDMGTIQSSLRHPYSQIAPSLLCLLRLVLTSSTLIGSHWSHWKHPRTLLIKTFSSIIYHLNCQNGQIVCKAVKPVSCPLSNVYILHTHIVDLSIYYLHVFSSFNFCFSFKI